MFKIGDVVTIRSWEDMVSEFGMIDSGIKNGFVPSMREYCDKSFKIGRMINIEDCGNSVDTHIYLLDEDGNELPWCFTKQMFVLETVVPTVTGFTIPVNAEGEVRFKDVKVGDRVYSLVHGTGKIVSFSDSKDECPVYVDLDNGSGIRTYTYEGKWFKYSPEAVLFYIDGDNLYAIERPRKTIAKEIVPVDTKVKVSNMSPLECSLKRHYAGKGNVYDNGRTSYTYTPETDCLSNWSYIILNEEMIIDGVVYPIGTRVV